MARKTTAEPKTEAKEPETAPQEAEIAQVDAPKVLKKPEILDEVVARTGFKKRDVKPAVEAAMAVISDALREGAEINLPPLGKIRVVKSKPLDDGAAVLTVKMRLSKNATAANADDAS